MALIKSNTKQKYKMTKCTLNLFLDYTNNFPFNPETRVFFIPKWLLISSNFNLPSGFVRISTLYSWLFTNFTTTSLLSTHSLMKWKWVSICLLLPWKTGCFTSSKVDLLSMKIITGATCFPFISPTRRKIHTHWLVAIVAAMNSTSHEERATHRCFYEAQVTRFPLK